MFQNFIHKVKLKQIHYFKNVKCLNSICFSTWVTFNIWCIKTFCNRFHAQVILTHFPSFSFFQLICILFLFCAVRTTFIWYWQSSGYDATSLAGLFRKKIMSSSSGVQKCDILCHVQAAQSSVMDWCVQLLVVSYRRIHSFRHTSVQFVVRITYSLCK